MIKLREKFMHDLKWIETSQSIEVISVHDDKRCKSGIAIRTNFTSLEIQLDIDSKFIFTDEQIQILKDRKKSEKFFKMFITSSRYGL